MAFRMEDVFCVVLSVSVVFTALSPLSAAAENATAAAESAEPQTCSEVRQVFVVKGIGSSQSVPDKQVKGDDLELCPSAKTCCTKPMEEHYQETVKKDFRIMLQSSGSYLKTLITTSASKFRETFLEMVQIAENNTNAIFSDLYQSMEKLARVPLSQFFADLLAYISGQEIDLEDRVNSFFDSLFPLAYHHATSPKQSDFSETYKECLREKQHEIRPFGDLPEKISADITRSFEAARTFLQALHLGVEVLNTTEHMDYGPECRKALVRLTYCPHCQGFLATKPCLGMCLNVARGCLSSVSELDDSWSEYVSALERLTSGMVGPYNIEQVLSIVDTKISETIMYVMENMPEINKRVKQTCGHHRRVTREVLPLYSRSTSSPSSMGDPLTKALFPRPSDTSLYMLLQNFVHKVAESKDFYSNLADRLCNDDAGLVIKGDLMCWNGQSLGEYTKTVAGVGVAAQKYNPEMTLVSRVRDMNVNTLADKLQHVKQILTSRVTSVPQSDSSVVIEGGSGSGGWRRAGSDDEDYNDGSGSEDYEKPEDKHEFHFERPETDSSAKKTSGSWSFHYCRGRTSSFILLTAILLHIRWHH